MSRSRTKPLRIRRKKKRGGRGGGERKGGGFKTIWKKRQKLSEATQVGKT